MSSPDPGTRLRWSDLLALAVLAAAVRALQLWLADGTGLYEASSLDGAHYREGALAIRRGDGMPPRPYLLSPLYPYFLSLFVSGGELHEGAVRVVQSLLGVGTCLLVASLAAGFAGRFAGLLAGGVAACFGPLLHFEGLLAVAAPQAFVLTLAVWVWLWARGRRFPAWLATGLLFGVGAALRPTLLAVGFGVAAVELVLSSGEKRAGGPKRAAGIVLGIVLAVAPFTIRNAVHGGELVVLTAAGGMNLWLGNHAGATGIYTPVPGYDFEHEPMARDVAEREAGHSLSHSEASAWWRDRALADIGDDPGRWLQLSIVKAFLFLHPKEIPNLGKGFEGARAELVSLRFPVDARHVLLLALLAPWLVAPPRRPATRRAWFAVLGYGAAVCIFFVTARYRLPVLPVAIALASATTVGAVGRLVQGRGWERAWVAVPVLLLLATAPLFAQLQVTGQGDSARHDGDRLMAEGRTAEAVAAYREAAAERDSATVRTNLGNALQELGRSRQAEEAYRRALQLDPTEAVAWFNLGLLQAHTLRRPEEARTSFEAAVRHRPRYAEAWLELGRLELAAGRAAQAVEALEHAVSLTTPATALGREARLAEGRARSRPRP